jgi:hypothetical protein
VLGSEHRRNEVADSPDEIGVVHEVGEELYGVGGGGQVLLHVLKLVLLDGFDDGLGERLRVLLVHNRLHIRSVHLQVNQFFIPHKSLRKYLITCAIETIYHPFT